MDKSGKTIGKMANQIISLVLALAFTLLSGGFAGLPLPAVPAFGGDLILFIGALFAFTGKLSALIGASWGSLMVLYEAIWERMFFVAGFATDDKYA